MKADRRLFAALLIGLSNAAACHARPAAAADSAVPRYAHVVVIVEENKTYGQILDPASAPNIAALAAKYGNATRFFGEVHPSEANYVAILGGDTFGIHDDDGFSCRAGSAGASAADRRRPAMPITPSARRTSASNLKRRG